MDDPKLQELCRTIYNRHHEAIDYLYEQSHITSAEIIGIIDEWCREREKAGESFFSEAPRNNTYTRFTTPAVRRCLAPMEKANSTWNSRDIAYYEICHREDSISLVFIAGFDHLDESRRAALEKLMQLVDRKNRKDDQHGIRLKNFGTHKINGEAESKENKKKITEYLNKYWKEIKKFEAEVLAQI